MGNRKASVSVNNLSTGYHTKKGNIVVTGNINASLFPGEVTCLLGPNGAGKSTLLKTLISFIPALTGSIRIFDKDLDNYSTKELSKVIGVVLTEKPDLTNMTVEELVGMGRSPYTGFWGLAREEDRAVIDEAIKMIGIESLRDRMIQSLSDGERQKAMIAKVLAQQTPVIFLDEPTAFLDYPSKVEIIQLLRNLAACQKKTILLSIHDLELAMQTADKIWLLDSKHGVTIGTPEDLALRNDIDRYFHRDGILFDQSLGMFKIINDYRYTVSLSGDGTNFNMVLKALTRKGIDITEGEKPVMVKADKNGIYVNGEKVGSIEEMLDTIESLTDHINNLS